MKVVSRRRPVVALAASVIALWKYVTAGVVIGVVAACERPEGRIEEIEAIHRDPLQSRTDPVGTDRTQSMPEKPLIRMVSSS